MIAFHASALDGVARNPALPTSLLLRLLAFDDNDGPSRRALQRAGLPEQAVAVILAHANPGAQTGFAMSARAEPAQRARLADAPPKVRAALTYGPEWHDPRTTVMPLPDDVCARLIDDPAPSVRAALLDWPHLVPSFVASLATRRARTRQLALTTVISDLDRCLSCHCVGADDDQDEDNVGQDLIGTGRTTPPRRVAVHRGVQAPVGVTSREPASGPQGAGGLQLAPGERAAREANDHSSTSLWREVPASPLGGLSARRTAPGCRRLGVPARPPGRRRGAAQRRRSVACRAWSTSAGRTRGAPDSAGRPDGTDVQLSTGGHGVQG
jgi:hypothetical protein